MLHPLAGAGLSDISCLRVPCKLVRLGWQTLMPEKDMSTTETQQQKSVLLSIRSLTGHRGLTCGNYNKLRKHGLSATLAQQPPPVASGNS